MIPYQNLNGNSNVVAYAIGINYIDVQFRTGSPYRYSYNSAGSYHVENMKRLARQGYGLNSYIMNYVRYSYER